MNHFINGYGSGLDPVWIPNPYLFRIHCAVQVDSDMDLFCGSVPELVVPPGRIHSGVILVSGVDLATQRLHQRSHSRLI